MGLLRIVISLLLILGSFDSLYAQIDPQDLEECVNILANHEDQSATRDKKECTQEKLCTIVSKLNAFKNQFNCHDARIRTDFSQLFSEVDALISKQDNLSDDVEQCCDELNKKIKVVYNREWGVLGDLGAKAVLARPLSALPL